jgi:imidazolonepropionase-like amidohydrolase
MKCELMDSDPTPIIIKNALLIDGINPLPQPHSVIVVEGSHITAVGELGKTSIPQGKVIDATGYVVQPGLIDAHVHITISQILGVGPRREAIQHLSTTTLEATKRLYQLLNAGFTTVLDCGGFEHIDLALRSAIENRLIIGPRLLCCGKAITTTGGHADSYFLPPLCHSTPYMWGQVCDGPDAVRKGVREEIKAGVDWIKLMHAGGGSLERLAGPPQMTIPEMHTAVEEAHKTGVKVCVHAQGLQSILDSIQAGVDSIEHGYKITVDVADQMKIAGITHKLTSLAKGYQATQQPQVRQDVPEIIIKKHGQFPYELKKRALLLSLERGVNVVAASDAEGDQNGHINGMEPAHWVAAGVSPMQAIQAMTQKPAQLLDVNAGTVEVGKLADLLIIAGNPLEDITVLQDAGRFKVIMKEGIIEFQR